MEEYIITTDKRGEGNVTTEAEIGMMWPQGKGTPADARNWKIEEQIFS